MITPSQFAAYITDINTFLGAVYATDPVDSVWKQIASPVPCSAAKWETAWTGLLPKMRAWFGSRVHFEAARQTYTVDMIPYESTLDIDRFTLDDDKMGVFYRQLPDMARQAQRWPDYELRDLIENAGVQATTARQLSLDGLTHWNTAHPLDVYNASAGTYSNDTTGGQPIGGVTVGGALGEASLATVWEYMQTIKGEDGERLGIKGNRLMHPPTMRVLVELLMKSMFFAPPAWGGFVTAASQVGAADNPLKRLGIDPLQNDYLNSNTKWYLLDTTRAYKPFLWINREAVRLVPRTSESDPAMFDRHMMQWGQWARGAPAWDFPFLSHRSGT